MEYLKAKKDYTVKDSQIFRNELLTIKEAKRLNILPNNKSFEKVNVPKNKTALFFGCRIKL